MPARAATQGCPYERIFFMKKIIGIVIIIVCLLSSAICLARGKFDLWNITGTGGGATYTADLPISIDESDNISIRTATDIVSGIISAADHTKLTGADANATAALALAATALPAATYNAALAGFDPNCGAWYKMDDSADSNKVIDSMGLYDGNSVRDTCDMSVTGQVGGALSFNGTSDYIEIDTGNTFQSDFSISVWFKATNGAAEAPGLLGNSQGNTGPPSFANASLIEVYLSQQQVWCYYNATSCDTVVNTGVVLSAGQENWHHIVITVKQLGINIQTRIYFDGIFKDEDLREGVMTAYTNVYKLFLGAMPEEGIAEDFFDGLIDDVRIFNKALSQYEIEKLYVYGGYNSTKATVDALAVDVNRIVEPNYAGWQADKLIGDINWPLVAELFAQPEYNEIDKAKWNAATAAVTNAFDLILVSPLYWDGNTVAIYTATDSNAGAMSAADHVKLTNADQNEPNHAKADANANTAYNWGNHASAGYATPNDVNTRLLRDSNHVSVDNNSTGTTLLDTNGLSVPVYANKKYTVAGWLKVLEGAGGSQVGVGGTEVNSLCSVYAQRFATDGDANVIYLVNGSVWVTTSGNFTITFAQANASGGTSTVRVGSWIKLEETN